jgi:hypothetical protein
MKDLLREVRELEDARDHAAEVAEGYRDDPDCECAEDHRRLAGWLNELLEIKKARLSLEVFLEQGYVLEPDRTEDDSLPMRCLRCGSAHGLTDQENGKLMCPSCGFVAKEDSV